MNNVSLVEQAILFGTESFIKTQKEYTKCKNKKKQLVIFVIFISNKKMESLKQRCLKILVGDSEKPFGKYFHEYHLFCASNEFLIEVERTYCWYCDCIYSEKKLYVTSVDLTWMIYHNTELETIDKTSKIPKIYRTLMIFIHLMKY